MTRKNFTLNPGRIFKNSVFLMSAFVFIGMQTQGQAPANDICGNATSIYNGTVLEGESTVDASTESLDVCYGFYDAYDVWYTATIEADGDFEITFDSDENLVVEMYQGEDCSSASYIGCVDEGLLGEEVVIVSGATIGEVYYFRVNVYDSEAGALFNVSAIGAPLAINLGNITALNKGSINVVNWNTLEETVSDRFELERSMDGKAFEKIADIRAKGVPGTYEYTDQNPVTGSNFYRLAMIHDNGKITYSRIVSAEVTEGQNNISVFPNPATKNVTVKIQNRAHHASLTLSDITGKVIEVIDQIDAGEVTISLEDLANGIYLIQYKDDANSSTFKVTKH